MNFTSVFNGIFDVSEFFLTFIFKLFDSFQQIQTDSIFFFFQITTVANTLFYILILY